MGPFLTGGEAAVWGLAWVSPSPHPVPVTTLPSPYPGPQSLAAPAKFPGNVSDKGLVLMTPSHPATISDPAATTK